jgi:hypothetical protein
MLLEVLMNNDFAQFLQLTGLMIWTLFPNGTMLFASWCDFHWSVLILCELEEENDFWFPLGQK